MPIVGVPKTIDNDLSGTEVTFGFDTAVTVATEAIDRLHTTAEAHERVMVVEVMGRYAGWIALHAGVAATADVILIPEIPFDIDVVCEKINDREARGRRFAIVVVAEGATPDGRRDGGQGTSEDGPRGAARRRSPSMVAREISARTGKETRTVVLGHLQRGGAPTTPTGCWRCASAPRRCAWSSSGQFRPHGGPRPAERARGAADGRDQPDEERARSTATSCSRRATSGSRSATRRAEPARCGIGGPPGAGPEAAPPSLSHRAENGTVSEGCSDDDRHRMA